MGYCVPIGQCGGGSGQSDQWVFQDATTGATAVFNYTLRFNGGDTTLQTSIMVGEVNYGSLNLNSQNVRNKDSLSGILSARYNTIFKLYGVGRLRTLSGSIERMLVSISSSAENANMRSLVFQSL
ncbi:MAG: hypothetical protein ABR502_12720, partial [Chitinophagaceae bacterium]